MRHLWMTVENVTFVKVNVTDKGEGKTNKKSWKMIQPGQAEHLKLTTHKNIVTTVAVQSLWYEAE